MTYGYVSGVPAWTSKDGGCENWEYKNPWNPFSGKTCVNPETTERWEGNDGKDAWDSDGNWDGCAPIAGSMVTAYHTGKKFEVYREWVIDVLHELMNTSFEGDSLPNDIASGIGSLGSKWSTDHFINWNDSTLKDEIDSGRPLLINMTHGGEGPEEGGDGTTNYGDHTCTVVGYSDNYYSKYIILHNTWDDGTHYFSWGNWWASSLIHVDYK